MRKPTFPKSPFALPKAKKPAVIELPRKKNLPAEALTNRQKAMDAIGKKVCLSFTYLDHFRVAEVHTVGTTTKGRPAMSVYQVDGHSDDSSIPGWQLFCFDECFNVSLSDLPSLAPRPEYKKGAKQFRIIDREV